MPLMPSAAKFSASMGEYNTPEEVLDALQNAVHTRANVFGIWRVPIEARRGHRGKIKVYIHRSVPPAYMDEFWEALKGHGPSFLAQYAWRHRRDFTQQEVVRKLKPPAEDLWIVQLNRRHGILDVLYLAAFEWWFVVFWWPKQLRLSNHDRRALRLAAEAAAYRIEELNGGPGPVDDLKFTRAELTVGRTLVSNGSPGLKNIPEMAAELKMNQNTIKTHIARMERKVGVRSIEDLAVELVRRYIVLIIALALGFIGICDLFDWCPWLMELA